MSCQGLSGCCPEDLYAATATYKSVKSYTAVCPGCSTGDTVTATSSYESHISQDDADSIALAKATEIATSFLECVPSVLPQSSGDSFITFSQKLIDLEGLTIRGTYPIDLSSLQFDIPPIHGTIVDQGDGTSLYTYDDDYFGDDSFTYSFADTNGCRGNSALINMSVPCVPTFASPLDYTLTPIGADVTGSVSTNGQQIYFATSDDPATTVGVGSFFPMGFTRQFWGTLFDSSSNWRVSVALEFKGNNGSPFDFIMNTSVDFAMPQMTCRPNGITAGDANLSFQIFVNPFVDSYLFYNGKIYPRIQVTYSSSITISSNTNFGIPGCNKIWHGAYFSSPQASDLPYMFFDEPSPYDAAVYACDGGTASQIHIGEITLEKL